VLRCPDLCRAVAFGPDRRTIAVAGANYLQLWDLSTRSMVRQLDKAPPDRWLSAFLRPCLAFSPNGRILAMTADHVIRLWEVATGREVGRFSGHGGMIRSLAFAPDGKTLISGSDDTTVLVWDVDAIAREEARGAQTANRNDAR
jgi:WD40 repeat protein